MQQTIVLRAEWFARLSEAIDGAQRVAWQLRTGSSSQEARELYSRLETARIELESLRNVAAPPPRVSDPDWLEKLGWSSALHDVDDQTP